MKITWPIVALVGIVAFTICVIADCITETQLPPTPMMSMFGCPDE